MKHLTTILPKRMLVQMYLEKYRANFFRQMMLFEFEYFSYSQEQLESHDLRSLFKKLLHKYYGKDVMIPNDASFEFLKVPHFYNYPQLIGTYPIAFIVGEYVASEIVKGKFDMKEFLITSSKLDYISLMYKFGIEIKKMEFVSRFFSQYEYLLNEFEEEIYNE